MSATDPVTPAMTRLSVNINLETAAALRGLAARHQTTVTEIIRRSVSAYKFIDDEVIQKRQVLQLVDGETVSVVHLL